VRGGKLARPNSVSAILEQSAMRRTAAAYGKSRRSAFGRGWHRPREVVDENTGNRHRLRWAAQQRYLPARTYALHRRFGSPRSRINQRNRRHALPRRTRHVILELVAAYERVAE